MLSLQEERVFVSTGFDTVPSAPMFRKIILITILILLAVCGYFLGFNLIFRSRETPNKAITWEECVKISGSVILETYPEQCKTPKGQTVANPNQSATIK